MNPYPTEFEEQCTFVEWLELKGLKFTAIPNSTWTKSWSQKTKNKQSGLRRGLPDMLVITPSGLAFVEMKRQNSPPSATKPEQHAWINSLNKLDGVECRICRGATEAIEFIEEL